MPTVRLPRLRTDTGLILVMAGAVLVFARDRATAESAAVDLADFHAGCRGVPVLPVALVQGERAMAQEPLPFAGAAPVVTTTRLLLPGLLSRVARFPPVPGLDPERWAAADYRPVPALIGAACALYAGHDVAALSLVNSGRGALARTRAAVAAATAEAWRHGHKTVVAVTGQPGAGKTLCGLDLAFTPGQGGTFLTGNPALLHVLRAALGRDAASRGLQRRAAAQRIAAVVQPLHGFRDQYVPGGTPPDRVLVIDEAQRCWTAPYAIRKTLNKAVKLTQSEPGHILDIMGRVPGPCVVVCLFGGGQEIHAGEGGLAGWGAALERHPGWQAVAPPAALTAADPRQRLTEQERLRFDPDLHLGEPVRAFAAPRRVDWVDAVLRSQPAEARAIAAEGVHVRLTRSLPAMQEWLRRRRGSRGLVASSGGKRLRAEGLGGLLWHQDEDAVARWFLDHWPDVRSAEALEMAATEFGVQGLELDHAGICWDQDLTRHAGDGSWEARSFRATAWSRPLAGEALSNSLNTYRVLLTRARQETVIWVPRGDARDPTRDPARYDAVSAFLTDCGAQPLDGGEPAPQGAPMPEPVFL